MSECRYYEFQAIDRPLGADDRDALRASSIRSRGLRPPVSRTRIKGVWDSEGCDDGSGGLAALGPLHHHSGHDHLLWLYGVEADVFVPDEPEPMPGLGPVTGAWEAFTTFFHIDRDLVAAAAERCADPLAEPPASWTAVGPIIAAMTGKEKSELCALMRERLTSGIDAPAARTHGQPIARPRRRDPVRP